MSKVLNTHSKNNFPSIEDEQRIEFTLFDDGGRHICQNKEPCERDFNFLFKFYVYNVIFFSQSKHIFARNIFYKYFMSYMILPFMFPV